LVLTTKIISIYNIIKFKKGIMTDKKITIPNNIRKIRESKLLSLAELVRRTGLSSSNLRRIEEGASCRMETKRKILEALKIELEDSKRVFPTD
jgi:transcriptional regulator with XRE-family HTH domain